MRGKTPKQKLLTELSAAYSLCLSQHEDFIWKAYGQRLRDVVMGRVRFIVPDPDDVEACRKYEKKVRIAILDLHTEVQQFYLEHPSWF